MSRSCFSAAARVLKVPKFLRFLVFGWIFREYSRYSPDLSFRIISGFSRFFGAIAQTLLDVMHHRSYFPYDLAKPIAANSEFIAPVAAVAFLADIDALAVALAQ